jgi:hypothetical protein
MPGPSASKVNPSSLVRKEEISLRATKKDIELLALYAQQQRAAALPFLEEALAHGNELLRRAAIDAMRPLDATRAPKQLQATLAGLRKKRATRKEQALLPLLWFAAPSALEDYLAQGGDMARFRRSGDFDDTTYHLALFTYFIHLAPRLEPRVLLERLRSLLLEDPARGVWKDSGPAARKLAEALLDHESPGLQAYGARLLCGLLGPQGLEELEARGHRAEVSLAIAMCTALTPKQTFKVLSGYLRTPEERAEVLAALYDPAPAWEPLLEEFLDEQVVCKFLLRFHHAEALRRWRVLAAREAFDSLTRNACYDLGQVGDAEATPILLRWLRDPAGHGASPMLLTALSQCASTELIPELEALMRSDAGREPFYWKTIETIRARAHQASAPPPPAPPPPSARPRRPARRA